MQGQGQGLEGTASAPPYFQSPTLVRQHMDMGGMGAEDAAQMHMLGGSEGGAAGAHGTMGASRRRMDFGATAGPGAQLVGELNGLKVEVKQQEAKVQELTTQNRWGEERSIRGLAAHIHFEPGQLTDMHRQQSTRCNTQRPLNATHNRAMSVKYARNSPTVCLTLSPFRFLEGMYQV